MRILELCAGAGGLALGLEIACPQAEVIACVENEPHAGHLLRRRFPQAMVFEDVLAFDGRPLRGRVDCIAAGFPCQPFSIAGKRAGLADERWIWPDIARIIGEIEPALVFLENVPGLLRDSSSDLDGEDLEDAAEDALGGFGTVLWDLAELGFDAEWLCLRASDVGAAHQRKRVFILGYATGTRSPARKSGASGPVWDDARREEPRRRRDAMADPSPRLLPQPRRGPEGGNGAGSAGEVLGHSSQRGQRIDRRTPGGGGHAHESSGAVAHGIGAGLEGRPSLTGNAGGQREAAERDCGALADAESGRWNQARADNRQRLSSAFDSRSEYLFAPGPTSPEWPGILAASPLLAPALSAAEIGIALAAEQGVFPSSSQSRFRGLADGLAAWLVERRPRLQRGGNGVVPLQAAAAFVELAMRAMKHDAPEMSRAKIGPRPSGIECPSMGPGVLSEDSIESTGGQG